MFDLHIHTTKGSADSSLLPEDLILEAERLGLRGLCITEHSGPWDRHEFQQFASRHSVVLVRAMEVDTDMGHMLVFGLDQYQPGFHRAEELSRAARSQGGFVVSAHPFRGVLGKHMAERPYLYRSLPDPIPDTPESALDHPVFRLADAIEVANGGTADEENEFAMTVAGLLGLAVRFNERWSEQPRWFGRQERREVTRCPQSIDNPNLVGHQSLLTPKAVNSRGWAPPT